MPLARSGPSAMLLLALALLVLAPLARGAKWHPVVLIHGINNVPKDWNVFVSEVKRHRPSCRLVELASPFDGVPGSWMALHIQLEWFLKKIVALKREPDFLQGFDLVCHSQGAVICQALVQELDHGVLNFVSLAGPQMGVYGAGFFHNALPPLLRDTTVQDAYLVAYENWAQALLSPANLWHDPFHAEAFALSSAFLPVYWGLPAQGAESDVARRKRNYVQLKQAAYLVGNFTNSTFDEGIDPWCSGVFAFYDDKGVVVPMERQLLFTKDTFGLGTLHKSNRLVVKAVPGVKHDDWFLDRSVIRTLVLPLLSAKVEFPAHGDSSSAQMRPDRAGASSEAR